MPTISSLRFPGKSHRKTVLIPEPSALLAEFFGIMIGDGGINNPWQANITLNSEADAQYVGFVSNLCETLFRVAPRIMKRKETKAIVASLASTTAVDFLVDKSLARGNKLETGLLMPDWIFSQKEYRIACIRGLMDTDGGLYIHNHIVAGKRYSNIVLCFSSASPMLIKRVALTFVEFGIMPHINKTGKNLYLHSRKAIAKYLEIFGTSNARISSVYERWRDAGVV